MGGYITRKRDRKGVNNVMRPLCKACNQRPRALNYYKNGKAYYRKMCEACLAHGPRAHIPRWKHAGYSMKSQCEKCGFKSPHPEVFRVFHIDGNLDNCRPTNLKTICSNCAQVLAKTGITWRQGDLVADY